MVHEAGGVAEALGVVSVVVPMAPGRDVLPAPGGDRVLVFLPARASASDLDPGPVVPDFAGAQLLVTGWLLQKQ